MVQGTGLPRGRFSRVLTAPTPVLCQREFFIENLLVRIHFIIEMIRWTGLAPWEFEFPFPGSLASTVLCPVSFVGFRVQGSGFRVQRLGCRM